MDAPRARLIAAVAGCAALLAGTAGARTIETPRPYEAFFGAVSAATPPRAARAEVVAGGRVVASAPVSDRRARVRLDLDPGRYDLRLRFLDADGRRLGVARAESVWLLPRSAARGRRELRPDRPLAARLAAHGRAYRGWAAVWTHDLATGRYAGWNADAAFPAASTVKLGVLIAALGRFGAEPARSRGWQDVRDVATWSSNVASNRLLVRLGGSERRGAWIVQQTLWRLGARSSTFTGFYRLGTTRRTAAARDAPRPLPVYAHRRTTARDLGRVLLELHLSALGNRLALRRTGLSRHEARVALGLLLAGDGRGENRGLFRPTLGGGLPAAQKHGWTTTVQHSAAIAYGRRGPRIVVVLTYHPRVRIAASRRLATAVLEELGMETVRGG
ncbi:MAG: serine hydrolase [Thermoleophilia bacterium]|nr:serine hydrolase [Thermoleophilia bacterium]